MELDLSDTESVRRFVREFLAKKLPLHILILSILFEGEMKKVWGDGGGDGE